MNRLTHLLGTPSCELGGEFVSKSQKLFQELGLVYMRNGIGTYMPILMKSLQKLERIIHKKMREISALEVKLPVLLESNLLETSGRAGLPNLYKVQTEGSKSYILSPTCEEAVTHLLQYHGLLNQFQLPLSLYQISTKFRNEDRPRSGLLRSKEFIMKDLYIFDTDVDCSEESYNKVIKLYHEFFTLLQVPYFCVEGTNGDIGGLKSHEFHFVSDAGQDKIVLCKNCGHNENSDLKSSKGDKCQKCDSSNVTVETGIEVGHAFKLGTTFTEPFKLFQKKGADKQIVHMSSFGLGVSRILAASVEVLCETNKIIWPSSIAPYLVCIVPPKAGSKEEVAARDLTNCIYNSLSQYLEDDIIVDDRTNLTIGRRLQIIEKVGFPFLIVIGKSVLNDPPTVEVIDSVNKSVNWVQLPDVTQFVLDKVLTISKNDSNASKFSHEV